MALVPGLWTPPELWLGVASSLAHRGWDARLLALAEVAGGLSAQAAVAAEHLRTLPAPAVLVGHDAGAVVALLAAGSVDVAALVLLSPLVPGSAAVRSLTRRWDALAALARGRPVPPPLGPAAARCFGALPPEIAGRLRPEARDPLLDVVRGRVRLGRAAAPALLLAAADDPLLPSPEDLANSLGADLAVLPARGHWGVVGSGWQHAVATVHRWLVRRLGEDLLEFHAEAMAERDAEDDDDD